LWWVAELEGLNISVALARVCVVTVAYNSAAALRGMLGSVPPGLAVIVVDNASHDDSAAVAEAAGARVIRNAANLGFGAGCNNGIAAEEMAWSRLHYMVLMRGSAAARREAWARVWHHASKALGHGLTLRFDKLRADLAGLGGTLAWLRGKRA
jgi:glycosyltransferase involved in cell wall biosynthesis